MKKLIVFLLLSFNISAAETTKEIREECNLWCFTQEQLEKAMSKCDNNGGMRSISFSRSQGIDSITCKNGAYFDHKALSIGEVEK